MGNGHFVHDFSVHVKFCVDTNICKDVEIYATSSFASMSNESLSGRGREGGGAACSLDPLKIPFSTLFRITIKLHCSLQGFVKVIFSSRDIPCSLQLI